MTEAAPPEAERAEPVSRVLALVAAVVLGPGAGHFFVSASRRALAFVIPYWTLMVVAGLLVAVSPSRATIACFLLPVAVHIASLVDLIRLKKETLRRAALMAFAMPTLGIVIVGIVLRNGVSKYLTQVVSDGTGTMAPTLGPNDTFFVSKLGAPARGEIVVLAGTDATFTAARVVGLPGEQVTVREGLLSVAGAEVASCALGDAELSGQSTPLALEKLGAHPHLAIPSPALEGDWTVGPDQLLVLPDDRRKVSAARLIERREVVGRAVHFVAGGAGLRLDPIDHVVLPRGAEGLAAKLEECSR